MSRKSKKIFKVILFAVLFCFILWFGKQLLIRQDYKNLIKKGTLIRGTIVDFHLESIRQVQFNAGLSKYGRPRLTIPGKDWIVVEIEFVDSQGQRRRIKESWNSSPAYSAFRAGSVIPLRYSAANFFIKAASDYDVEFKTAEGRR